MKQERLERLMKKLEVARADHARMVAHLARLRQVDPDNVVEIAMAEPLVHATQVQVVRAEERLRAAGGGVKHRIE